jgi:hypothetical protein
MNQELYDRIYESLLKHQYLETEEVKTFIHEFILQASKGIDEYLKDLEETVIHLRETVHRLSTQG